MERSRGDLADRELRWLDAIRDLAIAQPQRTKLKNLFAIVDVRQRLGLTFSNPE